MNHATTFLGRLREFFVAVGRSCYDMEFYRGVRQRPWTYALRYIVGFQGLLALVTVLIAAPAMFAAPAALTAHVYDRFPDGSYLEIKKGELSTNLPSPFAAGTSDMLVTVDATYAGSQFPQALVEDSVFVGHDTLFIRQGKDDSRAYSLSKVGDFRVTKEQLTSVLHSWGPPLIAVALLGFGLLFWFGTVLGAVITAAAFALLAMLVGQLWKVRMGYSRWFASGLHIITLPTLLDVALAAFGIRVPYMHSVIFVLFMAAIMADERSSPTVTPDSPVSPPAPVAGPSAPAGPPAPPAPPNPPAKP